EVGAAGSTTKVFPPASTPRRACLTALAGSAEGRSAVRRQTQLHTSIVPRIAKSSMRESLHLSRLRKLENGPSKPLFSRTILHVARRQSAQNTKILSNSPGFFCPVGQVFQPDRPAAA